MDIKSTSSFPYPIWGWENGYKGEAPKGEHKVSFSGANDSICIYYDVKNHNAGIDGLIKDKKAAYECIVESSSVYYADKVIQDSPHFEVLVPADQVNKSIEVKIIVVALEKISECRTLDVDDVYEGVVDYPKGAMIGYIDEFSIPLEARENTQDLSKIVTSIATEGAHVEYGIDSPRIVIKYPKEFASCFETVEDQCPDVIESAFVFPALVYALSELHHYLNEPLNDWAYYLKLYVNDYYTKMYGTVPDSYEIKSVEEIYKITNSILGDVQLNGIKEVDRQILNITNADK